MVLRMYLENQNEEFWLENKAGVLLGKLLHGHFRNHVLDHVIGFLKLLNKELSEGRFQK